MRSILFFLCYLLIIHPAAATPLGVYGNVWDIAEPDMVDWIKGRLRQMEKDGRLHQFQEDARRKALSKIENPPPVPGILKSAENRVWTFDPTYTVRQTVRDHLGNVLAPAGTTVNPLDYISLTKSLVFVDGRDEAQVDFAKKRLTAYPRDKIVFVGGSWLKYTRAWRRQVFYDQDGTLTRHFHIKRVPAVLSQKGKVLQIQEVAL